MSLFNYPGQELHKNEHEAFKDEVLELKDEFESGKASISEEVMVFLQDWLARHIKGTDKKYTQVFNANGLS
jgi:hemerythrin